MLASVACEYLKDKEFFREGRPSLIGRRGEEILAAPAYVSPENSLSETFKKCYANANGHQPISLVLPAEEYM
jgi:hypothetical protein